LEWYSKEGYDVVKEKMSCCVSDVVEGRHGFNPLGKVINCNDYVFVSIVGCRVASHEVDAPFTKGTSGDEWV
jgi:hypothetical protein